MLIIAIAALPVPTAGKECLLWCEAVKNRRSTVFITESPAVGVRGQPALTGSSRRLKTFCFSSERMTVSQKHLKQDAFVGQQPVKATAC